MSQLEPGELSVLSERIRRLAVAASSLNNPVLSSLLAEALRELRVARDGSPDSEQDNLAAVEGQP